MVICVKKIVDGCDTNAQGNVIYRRVYDQLSASEGVVVDFTGVMNVTSSFINSSFVELADNLGLDVLKTNVRVTGVNRQIGNMIKERLSKQTA